jgi:hypothetical protein
MHCEECGQNSDWIGTDSEWDSVGERTAAVPLFECSVCGNRKHAR